MPRYKFVKPQSAETEALSTRYAAHSHAIRTRLGRGSSTLGSYGAHRSQETVLHKTELKGRFRLSGAKKLAFGSIPKKGQSSTQEQPSSGSSQVVGLRHELRMSLTPISLAVRELGSHEVDPFDSLPVTRGPQVDALVKYFLTGFDLNLTTVDPRSAWFPYAIQNSTTMHATLALAAAFWCAKMPSLSAAIQEEGLRQKGEAMRQVSAQLTGRDFPHNSLGYRLLLAAIASLANVEACYGDFRAADVHLAAAYALFQSCGSIEMIQSDYILCKCLNWVDLQLAVGLGRIPLFPAFHLLDEDSLPLIIITDALDPPLTHLVGAGDTGDSEAIRHLLKIFMTIRQALGSQASAIASPHLVRVLGNTADRAILDGLYGPLSADAPLSHSHRRISALLLSAQIFLYIVLRQMPATSPLLRLLCGRLRKTLGNDNLIAEIWATHYPTLLWIAFVGVLGSGPTIENAESQWYMSHFRTTMKHLNGAYQDGPSGIRRILANFLWDERSCALVLHVIIIPNPEIFSRQV